MPITAIVAVVIAVIALANLALVYRVAIDIRSVNDVLIDLRLLLMSSGRGDAEIHAWKISSKHSHSATLSVGFFTIWQWETATDGKGQWLLKSTLVPPGVDPGLPPERIGRYEGECEKKWVPASRI
jgi:hypothetical protein